MKTTELSQKSQKNRPRYKSYKAKRVQIDEGLFGKRKVSFNQSRDETHKLKTMVRNGNYKHPQLTVLPQTDYQRIKVILIYQNNLTVTTKQEQYHARRLMEEQKKQQAADSKAKIQKMLRIQALKKESLPLTQMQIQRNRISSAINQRAMQLNNQQIDLVKTMNKMVGNAKAATIRSRQLDQKKQIWNQFKQEEKRKDLMMQIERLKEVRKYEQLNAEKKEQQLRGKQVIIEQIKLRQLDRIRQKQQQQKQAQRMIKQIAAKQKDDAQKLLKKKQQQKKVSQQIIEANQKAILVKQKRKMEQKEESQKIMKYNLEKIKKEEEAIAEQKRIKEEKEKEIQRMRQMQEKASDRQSELDALKAKRSTEAEQRKARKKQKQQAQKRARLNSQLIEARKQQAIQKQKRLFQQAKFEKQQFQRILAKHKLQRQIQLKIQQERDELIKQNCQLVKKQIAVNGQKKKQGRQEYLQQGKKVKDKQDIELAMLQKIKREKLKNLQDLGVPAKFRVQLQNLKVTL